MRRQLLQLGVVCAFAATAFAADVQTRTVYDATLRNGFTIRYQRQEVRGESTRLYTNDSSFIDLPTAEIVDIAESKEAIKPATPAMKAPELNSKVDIKQLVSAASDKHQIDPDFIASVIRAESGFNPKARSPKGAQGLMQLMPATASKLGVIDAYDPAANVNGGTQYLRELLLRYDGDMIKALAAYNAGPQRVEQYHGIPPYHETRAYVARIVKDFNQKKLAQRKAKAAAAKSVASKENSSPATASGTRGR